jgi:hypothetical protein
MIWVCTAGLLRKAAPFCQHAQKIQKNSQKIAAEVKPGDY